MASIQALWSPHLRAGDRCSDDRECPEALTCSPDDADTIEVRSCKPPAQLAGAPCLADWHCSGDFRCRLPEGVTVGACDKAELGESCNDSNCQSGLTCKLEYTALSACVVPGTVGAPCTKLWQFSGCGDGLYCAGDFLDSELCAERLADGEACSDWDACRSNVCAMPDGVVGLCAACTGETCDGTCVDGACVWAPPASLPHSAPPPRWPQVQIELRADGERCWSGDECLGGVCEFDMTQCAEPPCVSDGACQSLPAEPTWCQVGFYSRTQRW